MNIYELKKYEFKKLNNFYKKVLTIKKKNVIIRKYHTMNQEKWTKELVIINKHNE